MQAITPITHSTSTSLTKGNQMKIALALIIGFATVSLAGCSTPAPAVTQKQVASAEVQDAQRLFAGATVDFDLMPSPDALLKTAEVVVRAEVIGATWGRTWYLMGPDVAPTRTIMVRASVLEVVAGDRVEVGDVVYFENWVSDGATPEAFESALKGREAALFLSPATSDNKNGDLPNPAEGAPAGAVIWNTGPQGFVVSAGDSQIVWPRLGDFATGTITDALPGGTLIPKG
jgi:hypothetical protein